MSRDTREVCPATSHGTPSTEIAPVPLGKNSAHSRRPRPGGVECSPLVRPVSALVAALVPVTVAGGCRVDLPMIFFMLPP
jgi:hypothetical protein